MTVYVLDHFTDTDGTDLSSHTPDIGTSWDDSGSGAVIISNAVTTTTFGSGICYCLPAPASADYQCSATLLTGSSLQGQMKLIVRGVDGFPLNGYVAGWNNTAGWTIDVATGGTVTNLAQSSTPAVGPSESHTLVFSAVGNLLTLSVDSSVLLTATDSTYTAINQGGILSASLVSGNLSFDDFELSDAAVGGGGTHSGLTGQGFITVSTPVACKVDLSGLPTGIPQGQGNPVRYFNLGSLSFGDDTTYYSRNFYIEHTSELVLMPHAHVHSIGYSFAPGITGTITEVTSL